MRVLSRASGPLIVGVASAVLLALSLLPLLVLGADMLTDRAALTAMVAVFASGDPWRLLAGTLGLAAAVTAVALTIGVPLGALLGRTNVIGRRSALLLHAFPFFLPPFVVALGWFHILGSGAALGSPWTSSLLFSPGGVVGILGVSLAPVVTGMTVLALGSVPPSLEDAARTMAGPGRVFLRILLPLSRPSIAFAALVVFALSVSDVGVAMFLRVRTYPAAVFARLGGIRYAPGEALAMALPLFAVALALLLVERRFVGRRSFSALAPRAGEIHLFDLGRWRSVATLGVWLTCTLSIAPLVMLGLRALDGGFAELGQWMGDSVINSLASASMAATLVTVVAMVLGHRLARGRAGSVTLDAVAMGAFLVPATLLGVGVLETWNRPSSQFVYTTMAILVVGLSARYAVVAIRTVAAMVGRTSPHFEEAAATVGAGYLRRLVRIVLPMHLSAVVAAWILSMVFCLRDLETIIVFYPPGGETLPVRLFTLEANGPEAVVAALATTHVFVTAAVLLVAGFLLWTGRRR